MGLSWSGPDALWGLSFFKRHSIPFDEISMSGILVYGLAWKGRFGPRSCRSCKVFCAMAFSDVGDFGLKTD